MLYLGVGVFAVSSISESYVLINTKQAPLVMRGSPAEHEAAIDHHRRRLIVSATAAAA
jgi:hypothetical protein